MAEVVNSDDQWFRFPLLQLSSSMLVQVLSCLSAREVLTAGESCHLLNELSQHNYIWRKLSRNVWAVQSHKALMRPLRWKQYYAQRYAVMKEGAFEWDHAVPKGQTMSKRYQHTGSVVGKKVYFIGGQELPDKRFDDIYSLNAESMQVEKVEVRGNMPKFARHTAVPIGDKIFLFGGFDGISQHFHLSMFDTTTNVWCNPYVGGECPMSRTNHASTSIGNKMYLFGGMYKDSRDRLVFLNDLYELDTTTLMWTKLVPKGDLPAPRCGHRMSALNGKLILFGGGSGEQWDKKYCDVHIYDPETNTWTNPSLVGTAPVCTFTVAFVLHGFFFVFGGQSLTDNNLTNDLYCLDLTRMEWIKMTVSGIAPGARDMASGSVFGNSMFMFGGYCGNAIESFHTLKFNVKAAAATEGAEFSFSMNPVS